MPGTRTAAPSARTGTSRPAVRPPLSAREAEVLRRLLAERAAAAGGAASPGARPAGRRPAGTSARRPTTRTRRPAAARKPAARKPAARTARTRAAREARRAQRQLARRRWTRRLVVSLGVLVVPALAALLLPASPAPHGAGRTDTTSLALAAQTTLLDAAGRYRQLEQQVAQRRAELARAEAAEHDARARAAADRAQVGRSAADLYRTPATGRFPLLDLSAADPGATPDVLYRQALADRAGQRLQGAVVRAQRTGAAVRIAAENMATARAAVAAAERRAAALLADVRAEVDGLSPAVTGRLAGLGVTPAAGPQQDRNARAVQRWQDYLARLAAAGIEPPSARDLAAPDTLPAGMSPALDAAGEPVPGVAWAVIGSSPVTVLPAETVAAVSSALSQLGKPFVPGAIGPDAYDCGGFTAASWLLAGYALPLTPAGQWTTGTPVPAEDLQVGDVVVTDGGQDAGIYLGDGAVVGASARTFQVAVRPVGGDVRAVRVTLPSPDRANPDLVPAAGPCGAALPAPGRASAAWGGYANGRIPASALCRLGVAGHALRCDAAGSYAAMSDAFRAAFGAPLCITDSYRSYSAQVSAFLHKPALAAVPGTSNHGWGLAVDLCGGINIAGSPQWNWMQANAGRFGFVNPPWARPGAEKPEPWHWEYGVFD